MELANRESRSSWRDFLLALKRRGPLRVEFVVSDDHSALKQAIREVLPEAIWQLLCPEDSSGGEAGVRHRAHGEGDRRLVSA
jgi:transposase-like protein